jgi:four helix bundle protein
MARIERFEEIEAWQSARELTRMVYAASHRGRYANDFRFCSQIQAAAVSVMSNIAEGFESQSNKMFISYLYRAKASAGEVRSQLYMALDQEYVTQSEFDALYAQATKTSKQTAGFIRYLQHTAR